MPNAIIETFAAALKTRLETITTGNGYNYTAAVIRRTARAPEPGHLQVRITQGERERVEGAECHTAYVQPFTLALIVMPGDADTTALDTYVNNLAADVEKCLLSADTWWTSITGVANVEVEGPIPFDEDEGYDGCEFTVLCHYRHVRGNPY